MKAQNIFSYILVTLVVTTEAEKGPVFSRFCRSKFECGGTFGYICGQNQTCHCDRFYVLNSYADKCVGGVGQKCRYDEHCIEGAFCEYQVRCQCKEELYPTEDGLTCSRSQKTGIVEPVFFIIEVSLVFVLKFIWRA